MGSRLLTTLVHALVLAPTLIVVVSIPPAHSLWLYSST
jgi:hypothetical protein